VTEAGVRRVTALLHAQARTEIHGCQVCGAETPAARLAAALRWVCPRCHERAARAARRAPATRRPAALGVSPNPRRRARTRPGSRAVELGARRRSRARY